MFGSSNTRFPKTKSVSSVVRVPNQPKPKPLPSVEQQRARKQAVHNNALPPKTSARPSHSSATVSPAPSFSDQHDSSHLQPAKRKPSQQITPEHTNQIFPSSDEDSESKTEEEECFDNNTYKRLKTDHLGDSQRRLRNEEAFSENDGGKFTMLHAEDIVLDEEVSPNRVRASERFVVRVRYPSASQPERFDLVPSRHKIDSVNEILEIASIVRDVYLTDKQAKRFSDPITGVLRPLQQAGNHITCNQKPTKALLVDFEAAVKGYNRAIRAFLKSGSLAQNLEIMHALPLKAVQFILKQVYDRAVSPRVDLLKEYKPGSDGVYGELLSKFVSRVLIETKLTSDQVFVDLGSGVGNVVLQAALQFGCESWGCEMMPNACELADKQMAEFDARCRLWGLQAGKVHLEKGDFLANKAIQAAVRKADVVLVNNKVFSPRTNQRLRDLFLDLKDGCYIISLESFAVGNNRDEGVPANLIQNKVHGNFCDGDVSWTSGSGEYFIATKDTGHLIEIGNAKKARRPVCFQFPYPAM
ncbi:hypothetical protein PZA11_006080 [Diplocarpon coronariae]|uniref:Histone-lysine N-methyltransferase, H3 lysine-79 specific n=1 Tax=Diplocarpon coronariae TaxID=2795749 RepID=A0A218YVU4_9HELO|nr:hypothetical protein JHW43_008623 [Diplocarpon mali]OWO99274.1 hypothetical protein B2J93_1162 [Marssonina coronariae]